MTIYIPNDQANTYTVEVYAVNQFGMSPPATDSFKL